MMSSSNDVASSGEASQQQQQQQQPQQHHQQHHQQQQQQKSKQQQSSNSSNNNNNNVSSNKGKQVPPLGPMPAFIDERVKLWDEYKLIHDEAIKKMPDVPIKITLPNGNVVDGFAFKSTPYSVVKSISPEQAKEIVVAKVNGNYHDLHRPFEADGSLQLFNFDSDEGKHCFWHSSAHVLGQVLERVYSAHLTVGPAKEGFYYDVHIPSGPASDAASEGSERVSISSDDLEYLTSLAKDIVKQKQPFQRLVVPRDVALKMFSYNMFKQEIIGAIPAEESVTLYRCGSLIDLCRGPHLPNTSFIKAFLLTKISGVYWKAKEGNPLLQRVYGISFPEADQLAKWEQVQREAAERDHLNIGKIQELFFFAPEFSPGSAFILPHGARIYNKLMGFIKAEYHKRGFTEVITPNMFNKNLWEISGHLPSYRENMFMLECDHTEYSLKPMNCPGHCIMFRHGPRSYRELPIRFADFGVLHRNEKAGALTGLTRVRRFQQDDGHIFCAPEMIQNEIKSCLDFMQYVYGILGFDFSIDFSTRPDEYLGSIETWNHAEKMIMDALNAFGKPWKENRGDGAFYGPKIDIHIMDALGRRKQCATVQLDYQLPNRFGLKYIDQDGKEAQPVIIHRAVYGSIERMMAMLMEHTAGKWPFWLSPRQCIVLPIAERHNEYAAKVQQQLHDAGYYVDVDLSDSTLKKKLVMAHMVQYNFFLVVGDEEQASALVDVRARDNNNERLGRKSIADMLALFASLTREFE